MPLTFFMHIGKTGGSAVRHALLPYRRELGLCFVHHYVRVDALQKNAKLMFCVRDPVDRFISGFNSRLRMGQPANNVPWDAFEERAFSTFKTPNDLAEALDEADASLQRKARFAMRGIRHVQQHQHAWFPAPATQYLSRNRRRVLWVGQTSTLSEDFEALCERLGLPNETNLPPDPVHAHRAPASASTELSRRGRRNIEAWYAEDAAFVRWVTTAFRPRCDSPPSTPPPPSRTEQHSRKIA